MISLHYYLRRALVAAFLGFLTTGLAQVAATTAESIPTATNTVSQIDLPTVLRLAGAQNLDVQIARERLNEANANRSSAIAQFFPWLSPGIAYHRRDGMAQAVPAGTVTDTHLESYAPGGTFGAQWNLGDAIYQSLAAKQLVEASRHDLETRQLDSTTAAAQGYFDLVKAKSVAQVLDDTLHISEDYGKQVHQAVEAGIAFKGDELRVETQTQNYRIALRQATESQQVASANLAQLLHLDSTVELLPQNTDLLPLVLIPTNAALDSLVQQALGARPELKQSRAFKSAASESKKGAVYGPMIPSLGAQVFVGAFGGGHDDGPSNFGASQDYAVGLSWRIGPGGLFDSGRINATKARLAAAELADSKIRDAVIANVVTGHNRVQSLREQMAWGELKLANAQETLRLTRERKQFGVGIVLEDIQAQQELARARSDYLNAIAEFNKAQYALSRAVGATATK
ncbi:MAG TPA: TolC family protein [Candidatus Limnocylindria bacterium]|jgi:outer membrane protein TolC|nr:TolC family protein [Candidatus Limnocylindria bacterium]